MSGKEEEVSGKDEEVSGKEEEVLVVRRRKRDHQVQIVNLRGKEAEEVSGKEEEKGGGGVL